MHVKVKPDAWNSDFKSERKYILENYRIRYSYAQRSLIEGTKNKASNPISGENVQNHKALYAINFGLDSNKKISYTKGAAFLS